jgi:hypothetical protein
MQPEIKSKVAKFLYHLGTENRAQADKELREIIKTKVDNSLSREFEKVKASFSKENS